MALSEFRGSHNTPLMLPSGLLNEGRIMHWRPVLFMQAGPRRRRHALKSGIRGITFGDTCKIRLRLRTTPYSPIDA